MKFIARWRCYACKKYMSYTTKMWNHGVCPECGFGSGSTICKVIEETGYWKRVGWFRREWIPRETTK